MIEETIQKLTASIEALTVQIAARGKVSAACVEYPRVQQFSHACIPPAPAVAGPVLNAPAAETPEPEAPKPDTIKKLKAKAAAEIAAAKAAEAAKAAPAPEPKLPEQKDVIDAAGVLLTATNQNDGGFLRNLAKELGLDKLRNAKPEQRQAVIDRINTELARVKESAV